MKKDVNLLGSFVPRRLVCNNEREREKFVIDYRCYELFLSIVK